MHYSGLLGHGLYDAENLGWSLGQKAHDWSTLVTTVTNHVRSLNFRYRIGLKNKDVTYINGLAKFVDPHTVSYQIKGKENEVLTMTAERILIAVGGRPLVPKDIPGALDYAITSDDIFSLKRSPGKTLCVGGSYIALECAGFLTELGYDVTVAVRSILLRGFDRQCAEKVGEVMTSIGTNFLYDTVVSNIEKLPSGLLQVTFEYTPSGKEFQDTFNTVLFATGRTPDLEKLNVSAAGVQVAASGKIPVINECTNVPWIYAVGDVCEGKQELTPVAIKAGEMLMKRIYGNSSENMNYSLVPTAIFTPMEYGNVGMSEEEAIGAYGEHNIEVYLSEFTTLEYSSVHRLKHPKFGEDADMGNCCLSKLVCLKTEKERVLGFHFVGPCIKTAVEVHRKHLVSGMIIIKD